MAPARQSVLAALRKLLAEAADETRQLPPERQLAERIGVGRRALRQALEVLEAEGALWRRHGQGTFLGPRPPEYESRLGDSISPVQVMEVRLTVEPVLARLAALRATPTDIVALTAAMERMTRDSTAAEYERADRAFHRLIGEVAGNALFLAMFDMVLQVRGKTEWAQMRATSHTVQRADRLLEAHREVLDAIARCDPIAAEKAMRDHLRDVALQSVGVDPAHTIPGLTP